MNHSPYRITFTAKQIPTLLWLDQRGYAADLLSHAHACDEHADGSITYGLDECEAWAVQEEAEEEAFLTCCGDQDLIDRFRTLLDSIV